MGKNKHITEHEWNLIHSLRSEGKSQAKIGAEIGRCKATINWVLNGDKPDFGKKAIATARECKYNFQEQEEIDPSSLPDTVLFKHSKEFII